MWVFVGLGQGSNVMISSNNTNDHLRLSRYISLAK